MTQSFTRRKTWILVTIALAIISLVIGFPEFQRRKDFPKSFLWTLAVVLGICFVFLLRSRMWKDDRRR